MVGGGDCKVATVEVEAAAVNDNTATLPSNRPLNPQGGGVAGPPSNATQDNAEKNNAANKEMELKNVRSTPAKQTSLFIIMSFIYAKLLVVVCVAYVISEVVTHKLPLYYFEGFFAYMYGMSILFLLYVFCFLLQESACCSRGAETPPPPPKPPKPPKEPKDKKNKKDKKDNKKDNKKDTKNKKDFQDASDVEAGVSTRVSRKRKTSQNDHSHGSFFLRIGAIAFGLGTMVYNGLEFGAFFEIPPTSPCFQILHGVNPLLQMVFTFMQMYFIFMNSRLNIHRFKVIARFGLMHVVATNLCVWVKTLVFESLKEITQINLRYSKPDLGIIESIRQHSLNHAGVILGNEPRDMAQLRLAPSSSTSNLATKLLGATAATTRRLIRTTPSSINRYARSTARSVARAITHGTTSTLATFTPSTSTTPRITTSTSTTTTTSTTPPTTSTTTPSTTTTTIFPSTSTTTSTARPTLSTIVDAFTSTIKPNITTPTLTSTTSTIAPPVPTSAPLTTYASMMLDFGDPASSTNKGIPPLLDIVNQTNGTSVWSPTFAFYQSAPLNENACGRVNIMGTIVQDAAPYLFPFIIEYSLIGAAVIYVMWKHIGRHPRWPHQAEADLERRLEAMLSRRAVALAHAGHGRVDCVGASKGLFVGLFLLVGSLICLILFFVLIHHPSFGLLAIYLADVSHCVLMAFSIIAIIIGFIRVQSLKFKAEEQSDLNDILLRVSGFGLFLYAVFSVIAGSLAAFTHEPNLLVMVTGLLAIVQVVLQMLFIADVSRRRVHLPEHDRSKPGRQVVTFLLICNVTMWVIYTFETQKVVANPVQLDFYGSLAWIIVQRVTMPLCIFHRFHSAVTLAEIWKTSYKARLE
ncbi:proton channel OtopLc isoform X3 [Microplitis mediator]|uniref:proton channel OtopLc isoform X3 n=1 Tax=Microplitis mediator TaxID=375433 RepID=UPI002554B4A4|nr:proton channel OtopLc isoform X3 [Microplitis mediator]XP_057334766.1 proton channel OtopLc isoform X3 [Microplitis mediator]